MKNLHEYPVSELKLVYRVLHSQITNHPDLMDSDLLHDLQRYLQKKAGEDGVDVSMHIHWSAWLESD